MNIKNIDKKNIAIYSVLFLIALGFITLYSTSTSPLFPYYYGSDSAQFQTMGMAWANGKIPYRDIFDHKGPMCFFFQMLSFKFFGSNVGIYYIQIICMFINIVCMYKIGEIYLNGFWNRFIAVVVTSYIFAGIFIGGNLGEEYCLPLVFISTYFQLAFLNGKEKVHNYKYAFIYGLAFGICFFSKVTNALSISAGILIIMIALIVNKQYKNLLHNAISFIAGFMVIALPFSIYFLVKGCFGEMMYAMIPFNVNYQKVMGSWVNGSGGSEWYTFFKYYFPYYCAAITLILNSINKNWKMVAYNILILFVGGYFFFDGTIGWQYMFMMIPNVTILLYEVFSLSTESYDLRVVQIVLIGVILILCNDFKTSLITEPVEYRRIYVGRAYKEYDDLMAMVPEEDYDSFVAFGASDMKDIYLLNDIVPCCKYFVLQAWHASFDKNIYLDIQEKFEECNASWILTDYNNGLIAETLGSKYYVAGQTDSYILYHIYDWVE